MRKSLFVAIIAGAAAAGPIVAQTPIPGLENFTLDRSQPTPTPTPSPVPTVSTPPAPTPMVTPPASPSAAQTPQPRPSATPSEERPPRPRATTATPTPSPTPTATPSAQPTAIAPSPTPSATATPPAPAPAAQPVEDTSGWTIWVALGALALVLIGGFAWWRSRPDRSELADDVLALEPFPAAEPVAPQPVPPPAPPPVPQPAPPPPPAEPVTPSPSLPGGLVTSSLKRSGGGGLITSSLAPDLRLALAPLRGGVDTLRATLEYELQVGNAGRGLARAVAVEAWLISASHNTAADLATLFNSPVGVPMLEPFDLSPNGAIDLTGVTELPREMIATISAGDRRMFVPVLAVRAGFIDGRGAAQVLTRAFLVGMRRDGQDRLAPLPLDRGARMHEFLAARPYGD